MIDFSMLMVKRILGLISLGILRVGTNQAVWLNRLKGGGVGEIDSLSKRRHVDT